MKKFIKKILICYVSVIFLFVIRMQSVLASYLDIFTEKAYDKELPGDPQERILITVGRYIQVFLTAVGALLIGIILYGGYLWMTAGGNEEQVKTAKKWISNSVIGLAIVSLAWAIAATIMEIAFQ